MGVALATAMLITTGCSSKVVEPCGGNAEYLKSQSVPDIVAPAGLVVPTDDRTYAVVPPDEATLATARTGPCLATPPDYFRKPGTTGAGPVSPAGAPTGQ